MSEIPNELLRAGLKGGNMVVEKREVMMVAMMVEGKGEGGTQGEKVVNRVVIGGTVHYSEEMLSRTRVER